MSIQIPPMPDIRDFSDGWNFRRKEYADALAAWERVARYVADRSLPTPPPQETDRP